MTTSVSEQILALRQNTLEILDRLQQPEPECERPAPPEMLERFRRQLQENRYRVLVVGEAKRGKSSFINALIGREILPTDVGIATSQVFLVSKAPQEAYRVRFEDDSVREIELADLPTYGSQVVADAHGSPTPDQVIRWIEADVPVRFLPDGVSLLDTPGLGALYAAHSQITQRFIPHADAVIYVLSSSESIGQKDLETIESILSVTPNLFFIQTRIDVLNAEKWEELLSRNEQVLRERFGNRLADPRVWPISSKLLMEAAATGKARYEGASRHQELAAALKAFLFRVAGLSRAASALVVAGQYYDSARQVLLGRVADLLSQSKEQRESVQQRMAERKQAFDADWGERGAKRQELMKALQQITAAGKQQMRQALEPNGRIDKVCRARIEALTRIEEAQGLADALPGEVIGMAMQEWRTVDEDVRRHTGQQLAAFMEAAELLARSSYADQEATVYDRIQLQTQDDWFEKFKAFRMDMMSAGFIVGIGGSMVAGMLSAVVFAPLAIAASVWAIFQGIKGWGRVKERQLQQAKQELTKHLAEVRDHVRRYYFDVDTGQDRLKNLVDSHFDQLVQGVGEQLQRLATERSDEAARELKRLKEQAELDERQRSARLAELRACLARWEPLGRQLQGVMSELERLEQVLSGLAQPQAVEERTASTTPA